MVTESIVVHRVLDTNSVRKILKSILGRATVESISNRTINCEAVGT